MEDRRGLRWSRSGCEPRPRLGSRRTTAAVVDRLGGYSSCNQVDDNGWTPLHHCVEAMVHWDQAWKIGVTLIDKMEVQWLRAKTERGQPPPPHRTALHMMACNSDRAVRKPELVVLLANKVGDVDPTDDQGRTPLMHAVGTGLLNVAKALVDARVDPIMTSDDGRTLANRWVVAVSQVVRRSIAGGQRTRTSSLATAPPDRTGFCAPP